MKKGYVTIPEGQMHYRHAGAGHKQVILLHMSGSSSDEYQCVGDLLAGKDWNVYAIDLLAFGGSDKPPRYYSLADHAKTIVAFMDAMNIDAAYLYGNMATANMAVHVAVSDKRRVNGLMLGHPLHYPDQAEAAQKRFSPGFSLIERQEDGGHLREMWSRVAKYGAPVAIADARFSCLHQAGEWGETLHWALFEDRAIAELLPDVAVPTVVVDYGCFGKSALPPEVAALLPGGKFDVYEGGTPYIARTHPDRVAAMIAKYFP